VTRIVSPDYALEAEKASITMVCMVEVAYDSGTVRVHDGIGSITISELLLTEAGEPLDAENGDNLTTENAAQTFLGIGDFGGIESVEENIEVVARQVTLTCSGLDSPRCPRTTRTARLRSTSASSAPTPAPSSARPRSSGRAASTSRPSP